TFGDAADKAPPFHYHEGIETEKPDEQEEIETIEEWFNSWHRETELTDSPAMEFELEKGDSQLATGGREEAGADEVQQTGKGDSSGEHLEDNDEDDKDMESGPKRSGGKFGRANEQVVYHEQRLLAHIDHSRLIADWRRQQAPYVRSLLKELKKRITQRHQDYRTNL